MRASWRLVFHNAFLHVSRNACFLLIALLLAPSLASGQPANHSPREALWRSFIPGWGQIYNQQYYKLPVVYGGLGGLLYGVLHTNGQVTLYRQAHLYAAWYDPETMTSRYDQFQSAYQDALRQEGVSANTDPSRLSNQLKRKRENIKRNRNLFIIGLGLFYGLTVLDAYVSAHLLNFDVSEELSVRMRLSTGRPYVSTILYLGR